MKSIIYAVTLVAFSFFSMSFTAYGKSSGIQSIITQAAKKNGIPGNFALSVAKLESGFNPSVTGKQGEIGLFQLKCATAKGMGYSGSCKGLYNPSVNAFWGTRHLSIGYRKCGTLHGAAALHQKGLGAACRATAYSRKIIR